MRKSTRNVLNTKSMRTFKLFGNGQDHYLYRPLPSFPNRQAHFLLCYLLLNRQVAHSREKLATIFWHRSSIDVSRGRLRDTLWRLRHIFRDVEAPIDEYVSITGDSIAFVTSSNYWLDIERFETGCRARHNYSVTWRSAGNANCCHRGDCSCSACCRFGSCDDLVSVKEWANFFPYSGRHTHSNCY